MVPSYPTRLRGFTLIELLVVIGIVAILAGMLMPAISLVRASARSIQCSNTLRTFFFAAQVYPDDHEGWALPIEFNSRTWFEQSSFRSVLEMPSTIVFPRLPRRYICPEASRSLKSPSGPDNGSFSTEWSLGYVHDEPWSLSFMGFHTSSIKRHSAKMMMGDGLNFTITRGASLGYIDEVTMPPVRGAAYRHRGSRLNVVYWDGHVQGRTKTEALADVDSWDPKS